MGHIFIQRVGYGGAITYPIDIPSYVAALNCEEVMQTLT